MRKTNVIASIMALDVDGLNAEIEKTKKKLSIIEDQKKEFRAKIQLLEQLRESKQPKTETPTLSEIDRYRSLGV